MAPSEIAELMGKGAAMLQRQPSQILSQGTDDGDDYAEEEAKKEFIKFGTSAGMQKRVDKYTEEVAKLVKEHEKSKMKLIAPVKVMIHEKRELIVGILLRR